MPIIAEVLFSTKMGGDGTIKLLTEKIKSCGCIDLVIESKNVGLSVASLLNAFSSIDGVVCNDEGICCAANVTSFAETLKKFQEEQ